MNRPWSRRPTDPAALTRLRADAGSALRRPADPELPPRLTPQVARDAVNQVVTDLHARGALDAGNGDVLDGWLDAVHPLWRAHATMAATEHAGVAQLAIGDHEAEALAARQRADAARAELEHTQRLVDAYDQALLPVDPAHEPDRRHRRPDLDRLEGVTAGRWSRLGAIVLLALVGAGDLVTFWMTLAGLLRENGVVTWVLVGSFTFASIAIMHFAGHTAKNAREGHGGLGKSAVLGLVSVWGLLGAVTFYVRTQYTATDVGSTATAFGADPAATPTGPDPMLSALLLLGLFLASGFLAFWVGFSMHHPRMSTYRALRRRLTEQRATVASAEQAALAAERLLDNARLEEQRVAERSSQAESSVAAEISELKELARLHLAGLLAEPATTNAVTTGRGTGPATREPAEEAPVATVDEAPDDAVLLVRPAESLDALLTVPVKRINGSPQPTIAR